MLNYLLRKSEKIGIVCFMLFMGSLLLVSCSPVKHSYYFKELTKDSVLQEAIKGNLESRIIPGDKLAIQISSLNKEEDITFNASNLEGNATVPVPGYWVDSVGMIELHKIGMVKAEGLTRNELAAVLKDRLIPFLKNPMVSVQYMNRKVTIMGEVEKPQVINLPEEKLPLLEALAICGDVNPDAKLTNLVVIRENGQKKEIKLLSLEDLSTFSSEWYYVQPNDIVIVKPDIERKEREWKRTNFQVYFSIILSSITLLILLLDRFI